MCPYITWAILSKQFIKMQHRIHHLESHNDKCKLTCVD